MNKIGIHYGAFVKSWTDNQFPFIRKAHELGFDVLEFGVPFLLEMSDEDIKRFRDEAEKYGITLILSLGLTPDQDVGSPDPMVRETGINILKRTAIAMAKVGATDCSGIVYGGWNAKISDYSEKAGYWERSVQSMKEVVPYLEENDVYFNLEIVNRFENFLINTCKEALAYIEDVGSDHIGVHLDTFHMNIEEDSMVTPIMEAGDKLRYFHIGENNRKFPGLGNLDWKTIFDTLKAVNYTKPITMEPFVKPGGEAGSAVSLYRDMMDTSDYDNDLIRSLTFVRSLLR